MTWSTTVIVDSGEGSTKNLALMNLPPANVTAVFLTHYHSDHIADLGELMLQHWAGGATTSPLTIYGPVGLEQVVTGFQDAFVLDRGYRIAHHGPTVVPPGGFGGAAHAFSIPVNLSEVLLIDTPDLKVYAFPVDHQPVQPAVGYLFIYKGRRVVISGDTAPDARVEAAARNADVLVHEGLAANLVADQRAAVRSSLVRTMWHLVRRRNWLSRRGIRRQAGESPASGPGGAVAIIPMALHRRARRWHAERRRPLANGGPFDRQIDSTPRGLTASAAAGYDPAF